MVLDTLSFIFGPRGLRVARHSVRARFSIASASDRVVSASPHPSAAYVLLRLSLSRVLSASPEPPLAVVPVSGLLENAPRSEPRTGALWPFWRYSLCEMPRKKQTARTYTGGKVPCREIATRAARRSSGLWHEDGHDVRESSPDRINRKFIDFKDRRNAEHLPSPLEHGALRCLRPVVPGKRRLLPNQVQAIRQASIRRGGRIRHRGPTSLRVPCAGVRLGSPGAESLVHGRSLVHRDGRSLLAAFTSPNVGVDITMNP